MAHHASGVSVVVVNWNTKRRLLKLLARLERAEWRRDHEVIVVDNASEDGSVAAVQTEFPDVRVLPQKSNLGFGAGANRGAAVARHDFVLFLNTDVTFDKQAIDRFVAQAEPCRFTAVHGPRIVDTNGRPQRSHWNVPTLRAMATQAFGLHRALPRRKPSAEELAVDCVSGCVFLVQRDAFEQLGGFDEDFFMYFEETDLCRRAREAGLGVRYSPVTTFVHEGGGSGHRVRGKLFAEFRRSEVLFHRKRAGKLASVAARMLSLVASSVRVVGLLPLTPLPLALGERARQKLPLHFREVAMSAIPMRKSA